MGRSINQREKVAQSRLRWSLTVLPILESALRLDNHGEKVDLVFVFIKTPAYLFMGGLLRYLNPQFLQLHQHLCEVALVLVYVRVLKVRFKLSIECKQSLFEYITWLYFPEHSVDLLEDSPLVFESLLELKVKLD